MHPQYCSLTSQTVLLIFHIARTLPAIGLRLGVRIACDGLQQKFQHAEHFTCDSLISQLIFIQFSHGFHN